MRKEKKMENYNYFAPQGWQCPICKRVYSPSTSFCLFCGAESTITTSTGTGATIDINGGLTITYPLEGAEE